MLFRSVLERYSYDPFGKTRNLNGSDIASATTMPAPSVRRGFTGHEMMPEFAGGLIHMNGRIYDPNLGRFMTADPNIQSAGYSQSYNRYSYGFNNPLSGTDPSGYSFNLFDPANLLPDSGGWLNPGSSQWDALHGAIQNWAKNPIDNFNLYALERAMPGRATMDNFMISHEWAMDLGHVALAFASAFCYAGAAACYAAMEAHVAGYMTWLGGGSHEDAFGNMIEAGAIAFVSASANYAIGQGFNTNGATVSLGTRIGNVLAHAALGCAMAEAGGGKCGAGALSGAITAGVDQIQTGSFAGGFAMAMVAGCAGSAAGGGSCSRGAASSALIYLYNKCGAGQCTLRGMDKGFSSYVDGLYQSSRQALAISGALGTNEQNAALAAAQTVSDALDFAASHPGDIAEAICIVCMSLSEEQTYVLQVQMGTRLATGGVVTVGLGGVPGVGLAGAAIYGNMIGAARVGGGYVDIIRAGHFGQ